VDDDRVTSVWFQRKNRLGKGNVHLEEKLTADLTSFVEEASLLQLAVLKRRRKR
jgi:hypothetical protein